LPFNVYFFASRLARGTVSRRNQRSDAPVQEHKSHDRRGFAARYGVDRLVWFEAYDEPRDAIAGKGAEEMAAGLKDPADRKTKPGVA
jgi:hypothetical protein